MKNEHPHDLIEMGKKYKKTLAALKAAKKLMPFIAPKGTIAVNGVSLTVTEVTGTSFGVALIPHTLKKTTLGKIQEGSRVNLEIDMIVRAVVRFLTTQRKKSL